MKMKRMKKFSNLKKMNMKNMTIVKGMKNIVIMMTIVKEMKNIVKKKVSITRRKMMKRKMNMTKKRINVMKMRMKVRMMNFVAIINKKQITLMYGMNNVLIDIIIHFNILSLHGFKIRLPIITFTFVYGASIM